MPPKIETKAGRVKLLVHSGEISTRMLLEISLNPENFTLEFSRDRFNFKSLIGENSHDVYVIDAAGEGGDRLDFFNEISAMKFAGGMRRILLIVDRPMPPEANGMQRYGPLCFVEAYFSRARLNETLRQLMTLQDTGVRVKADSRFFDITKIQY